MAILDRYQAALAPLVAKAGMTAAPRDRNAKGLATCEQWQPEQRACLLAAPVGPPAWAACKVDPPFVFYDGALAHMRLLGAPVTPAQSDQKLAELVGTWVHPAVGRGDAITWTIAPGGQLAAHRVSTDIRSQPVARDEPAHELAFVYEHELAIKTGSSSQFVPAFVVGDKLYVSWTSGALAVPVASDTSFVLDLADRDRWLVWLAPACAVIDPQRGAGAVRCYWKDGGHFVADGDGTWLRKDGWLVHPAMDEFSRQGR